MLSRKNRSDWLCARLSIRAMAIAGALLWGGAVMTLAACHAVWPSYGAAILQSLASVYPGFPTAGTFGSVVLDSIYGLADGAAAGALLAWLYNWAAG